MKGFEIAGGSIPGFDHIKPGQPVWMNNQDGYAIRSADDHIVAIVCDGCGSKPHAEVGAQLGSQLVSRLIAEQVPFIRGNPVFGVREAVLQIQHTIVWHLLELARLVGNQRAIDGILANYFLFTIVGTLITPEQTVVFSFGDGVIALNGAVTVIDSGPDNMPAYIAYRALKSTISDDRLIFNIHSVMPTKDVHSILIGCDGVADFIAAAEHPLPGKSELVGPLSQFWTDEKFVTNPDRIRRRLAQANRERVEDGQIKHGLLHDDTTLVVARRMEGA
jgi:Protein phosphatase 2C